MSSHPGLRGASGHSSVSTGFGSGSPGLGSRARTRSRPSSAEPEPEPEGPDEWPQEPLRPTWLEMTRMWQEDSKEAHKHQEVWAQNLFRGDEHLAGCSETLR